MKIYNLTRCSLALAALSTVFAGCSGAGPQVTPAATSDVRSEPQAASARLHPASTQVNWSQTYFNSAHIGFNAKETTISTGNVGNLTSLWGQNVTGGVTGLALGKGMIFAQGSNSSGPPTLVAMNAATGSVLWTITTGYDGYALNGTVATGMANVYVGCGTTNTGNPGGVCAFSGANGKPRWSEGRIAELERHTVFSRTWQVMGRVDQVEKAGQFVTATIAGEPLADQPRRAEAGASGFAEAARVGRIRIAGLSRRHE